MEVFFDWVVCFDKSDCKWECGDFIDFADFDNISVSNGCVCDGVFAVVK